MKNISTFVQYPADTNFINHITKITDDTYLSGAEKLISKSDLDRKLKKQVIENAIKRLKAT